jgi:predicted O-methyltransferase YrrM
MTDEEMMYLYRKSTEMDTIVELGCWKGRSTHAIASGCKGIVYAIDHFKGSPCDGETAEIAKEQDIYSIFTENTIQFNNIIVLKMSTTDASETFDDKSVDMVFIDAGHNYVNVSTDIKNWLPKAKKLICGHDFPHEPVKRAVEETFGKPDGIVGSIWYKNIKENNVE